MTAKPENPRAFPFEVRVNPFLPKNAFVVEHSDGRLDVFVAKEDGLHHTSLPALPVYFVPSLNERTKPNG